MEPIRESHLDAMLMRELVDDTMVDIVLDEPDDADYAAYEVLVGESVTARFVRVRDTSRDLVETVKYPRIDLEPVYSEPYAKVDVATSFEDSLPLPLYSVPFERVEIDLVARYRETTEIIEPPASIAGQVMIAIVVLTAALLFGLGLVLLIAR